MSHVKRNVFITTTIALGIGLGVLVNNNHTKVVSDELTNFTNTTETNTNTTTSITKPLVVKGEISSSKQSPSVIKLSNRVLSINGVIDSNVVSVAEDIKRLSLESTAPIYLQINSPGGSVFHGSLVISAIKSSKAPVITVCTMLCASMAAVIHQFGTERQMVEGSTIMFHNAAGGEQGYVPQMMTRLNYITRYLDKIDEQIANRAGIDLNTFKSRLGDEVWLDAEDATDQHFNDKIVSIYVEKTSDTPVINFIAPAPDKDNGKAPNPVINLEWK